MKKKSQLASKDIAKKPASRLAGEPTSDPKRRLAGLPAPLNVVPIDALAAAPLTVPLNVQTLFTSGIKILAARKRSLYDNRSPVVGMRLVIAIQFSDSETNEPMTPTVVKAHLDKGNESATLNMVENSGRVGYFTASYVPDESGEWMCRVTHGNTNELVDRKRFYVVSS